MFDLNHNEGGRGLVCSIKLKPLFIYIAFWTRFICPRVVFQNNKLSITFDP
jgi:hypothetical protein